MTKTLHGQIRGRTIEVVEDLGLAEGQQVEIKLKIVPSTGTWGDGLRRCAGALANEWTDEDDRILEELHKDRKRTSGRDLVE